MVTERMSRGEDEQSLVLSDSEQRLYQALRCAQGRAVAHRDLCLAAWGYLPALGARNRLKSAIQRLRRKLGLTGGLVIVSHRGIGYSLRPAAELLPAPHTRPSPETGTVAGQTDWNSS